jgi:DNA repair protein RadD
VVDRAAGRMILRPYQAAAIDAVFDWARTRPGQHPLLVLPTGAGKTAVMSGLVRRVREAESSARVLLLAHRRELLEQAVATAWKMFPPHEVGLYGDGLGRKDTAQPIIVASIQSLMRDPYVLSKHARPIDVVLVDECHMVNDKAEGGFRKTLAGLMRVNPATLIVGLTATPYRMKTGLLHEGEDALFSGIAYEVPMRRLLEAGYLCPIRPRGTTQRLSTEGVAVRGDYVPSALAAAVDVDATTRAIVSECVAAFQDRRSWLVFGCSVEHITHLADAFRAAGVRAQAVWGDMDARDRTAAIAAHKSGELTCAVTCDLLTVGYDNPSIDAIAMCRPTKSPGLYSQMAGRGLRIAPGKVDCLVLDFAGNVLAHGPVDTLNERIVGRRPSEPGVAPAKECPSCQALVAAGASVCSCGHEFPPPAPPKLEPVPSARPLLSIDVEPTWHDVTDVQFSVTDPKDPGKVPTLCVEYLAGYRRVAREWWGFGHPSSMYRAKSAQWWRERFPDSDIPESPDEAWEWLTRAPAMHYTPSAVATMPDGQWTRVSGYRWPDERAAWLRPALSLPRACWTCAHWKEDACQAAGGEVPPEDVQVVGCEEWALFDDAGEFARTMTATGDVQPVVLRRAA